MPFSLRSFFAAAALAALAIPGCQKEVPTAEAPPKSIADVEPAATKADRPNRSETSNRQPDRSLAPSSDDISIDVDRLWNLLRRRATLAGDVARWKWNQHASIEDPERERKLLESAAAAARAKSISVDFVREVFQAQMDASRTIQSGLFEKWRAAGITHHENVVDLKEALRPAIDETGNRILEILKRIEPVRGSSRLRELIEKRIENADHDAIWTVGIQTIAIAPFVKARPNSAGRNQPAG